MELMTISQQKNLIAFDRYAKRIKGCLYDETVHLHEKVLLIQRALKILGRSCLLPNLQYIWIGDLTPLVAHPQDPKRSLFFQLYGSHLTSVETSSASREELLHLLPHLSQTAPCLRYLWISNTEIPSTLAHLLHFPDLQELETAGGHLFYPWRRFRHCFLTHKAYRSGEPARLR